MRNLSDKNIGQYVNEMNRRNEEYNRKKEVHSDYDEDRYETSLTLVKPILVILGIFLIAFIVKIILTINS